MRRYLFLTGVAFLLIAGCEKLHQTDYTALDQSGMWSSSLEQLKALKVSDPEVGQLTKLKQAGASDDLCLALIKAAHDHHHEFSSADSVIELSRAGYPDTQILELAKSEQIDVLSGEAVTLKLIGLSNPTIQQVLARRMQRLPTLTSAQIGRLKNTAMSEPQIVAFMNRGLSDQMVEAFITEREAERNHAHTGFVRTRGRRRR